MRDWVYAVRTLRRAPGFAVAAVLTLALGIGINTAVFSAAYAVFLKALPYPDADRMVLVSGTHPGGSFATIRYSDYEAMERHVPALDALSAFQFDNGTLLLLGNAAEPAMVRGNFVTPSHLQLQGARAALGRTFTTEENAAGGNHAVALLSHAAWQLHFGGDPAVCGRVIHLNRQPVTIIGVLPAGFRDVAGSGSTAPDVWLPARSLGPLLSGIGPVQSRGYSGIGRLREGATLAQARAEIRALSQELQRANPATQRNFGHDAWPLREALGGGLRRPSLVLTVAAVFLLAIACANIAALFLVNLAARRREFAVRAALGATPARLLRQLLVECVALAACGGALGALLAVWLVRAFSVWIGSGLPAFVQLEVNAPVLIFCVGLLAGAAVLFGLVPALVGTRVNPREAIQQSRASTAANVARLRVVFVSGQIALCAVLLLGAGLLLKSQQQLSGAGLGYDTENLLTFRMNLGARYATQPERAQFTRDLLERFAAIRGVASAAQIGPSTLGNVSWISLMVPEGKQGDDPLAQMPLQTLEVSPGTLRALGIPLLRGRDISWDDTAEKPLVAVVSQGLAQAFWPGQDAVGKRFRSFYGGEAPWVTVIGVAADARHRQRFSLADAAGGHAPAGLGAQRDYYRPYAQSRSERVAFAVRVTTRSLPEIERRIRDAVRGADPNLAVYDIAFVDERLRRQDALPAAIAALMGLFAFFALLLASTGLYGALAYATSQRTKEIGIRMALGAERGAVLALVARQGFVPIMVGATAGIVGAAALGRAMQSFLFGVNATDWRVFAAVCAVLAATCTLAVVAPARRAARIDPAITLRAE